MFSDAQHEAEYKQLFHILTFKSLDNYTRRVSLNEKNTKTRAGKRLFINLVFIIIIIKGMLYRHCFSYFPYSKPIGKSMKNKMSRNRKGHNSFNSMSKA